MDIKRHLIHYFIILAFALTITACADSDTPEATLPTLIEALAFPYIEDATLYSLDHKTGLLEKLVESNRNIMLALDIDQSVEGKDDNEENILEHTTLPEYAVYVVDQTIRLYDLHTQHDHLLINFTAESVDETEEYICSLTHLKTVDTKNLAEKKAVLKDEKAFYAVTSTDQNCNSNFKYLQVKIEESFTETFQVRRTSLKEHKHSHTHLHQHTDDDDVSGSEEDLHTHAHKASEDNIYNHRHSHTHTHDFLYVIMSEHQPGSDPEDDSAEEVHADTDNHETITETHKELVGKTIEVDPALVFSGDPIVDSENKQFGYLGFNAAESTYKFYTTVDESLEKFELWTLHNTEFSQQPQSVGIFRYGFTDSILIEFNWKMAQLNYEDIFDDDMDNERESALINPVFTRTAQAQYTLLDYRLSELSGIERIVIQDNNSFYSIFNDAELAEPTLIKDLSNNDLNRLQFQLTSTNIIALKIFNEKPNTPIKPKSMTAISLSSKQETTLIGKTDDEIWLINLLEDNFAINKYGKENINLNFQMFQPDLTKRYSPALENSLWAVVNNYPDNYFPLAIVASNSTILSGESFEPVLDNPTLYYYDGSNISGQGNIIGNIPSSVANIPHIEINNDLYGLVYIQANSLQGNTTSFYFNPDDPTIEMIELIK